MILIFGGAYQGKLVYALEKYNAKDKDVFRCAYEDTTPPPPKRIIYGFEKWLYALVHDGQDCEASVITALPDLKNSIIICNDISGGVVPTDPVCRKWREDAGRAMALIGSGSDEVVRVFCSIATRLK